YFIKALCITHCTLLLVKVSNSIVNLKNFRLLVSFWNMKNLPPNTIIEKCIPSLCRCTCIVVASNPSGQVVVVKSLRSLEPGGRYSLVSPCTFLIVSSICFRAVCLARLYLAIWGKSMPVLLGVIEHFRLTYESISEIPGCECMVDEGDLGSEGSRFRGTSRRQQQKWEPENTTIITKARPPKGKQLNYSDSNILRARKAGVSLSRGSKLRRNLLFLSFQKALVEIELSRKHQLNCVIKALAIAEK
uniref:Uncharacterized protein n=1 Tax=Glossina palpalis gambiensis TaxID=67801 RepID=A0A1B0BTU0_9MUSC